MRVPARNVLPIPDDFGFDEAAAVPLAFLTAWRALITRGRVRPGEDVLILGAGSGARDFYTQAVITGKLMIDQGIDDHHVFPAKFLEEKGITLARARDCVLNRTLIDRTTNQMIGDRAPSQYLADIRKTAGFPFNTVLASHCLPTDDASPLWMDDYDAFLAWRQDRLWREIQEATGLTEAADLEAGEAELS